MSTYNVTYLANPKNATHPVVRDAIVQALDFEDAAHQVLSRSPRFELLDVRESHDGHH